MRTHPGLAWPWPFWVTHSRCCDLSLMSPVHIACSLPPSAGLVTQSGQRQAGLKAVDFLILGTACKTRRAGHGLDMAQMFPFPFITGRGAPQSPSVPGLWAWVRCPGQCPTTPPSWFVCKSAFPSGSNHWLSPSTGVR